MIELMKLMITHSLTMSVTSLLKHKFQLKSKSKSEMSIYVNPKNNACKLLEIVFN